MILAIDTSTLVGSVALLDDDRVVVELSERVSAHSEGVLPLVQRSLEQAGISLAGVQAVACGAGPGTFTGLRIGMATAKGLCYASGLPLIVVSSLAALALNAAGRAGRVVALIDARKQQVYAGFYRLDAAGPPGTAAVTAESPEVALASERLRELIATDERPLLGDGALTYRDYWPGARILDVSHEVHASNVARLALARFRRGEVDNLATAEPVYLSASVAR